MAIAPPNWAKGAVPTTRGWTHARTGELLVARPISQGDIDQWITENTEKPAPTGYQNLDKDFKPAPVTLTESPTTEAEFAEEHLEDMTKVELEEIGREYGVELDRREKKSTLINKVKGLMD